MYDGTTTSTPTSAWLPKSDPAITPLLIGYTDAAHSDLLKGQPSAVAGMTRTLTFSYPLATGRSTSAIRAAVIALDRADRLPLTGASSWQAVLEHELGHAVGLAHAGSSAQLMHAVLPATAKDYQSGDRAGLTAVGAGAGCVRTTGGAAGVRRLNAPID